MVGKLSPEPPSNIDNQITRADRDGQDFIIQDSDDESTVEDNGYQLLSQNELDGGLNDMEEDGDDEENQQTESHNDHHQSNEEVQETVTLFNETRSSDIQIDADQIRSVMSNINLPSSSIPMWARSIPDGQLSSILHSHIDRLQQR
uniref:Male-enhanced antigen 1 n=1 Tax=Cacopsylla melanoneura TaxID=428564 RepID=A0A8D8YAG9_9HEMI